MVIDVFYDWRYWVGILSIVLFFRLSCRVRLFDFTFYFINTVLVCHAYHLNSWGGKFYFNFCIIFYLFYLFFRYPLGCKNIVEFDVAKSVLVDVDPSWILLSKYFIIVYYFVRLVEYPFFGGGDLLLDERLAAQKDNRFIFLWD